MTDAERLRDFAGFAERFGLPEDAEACLAGAAALEAQAQPDILDMSDEEIDAELRAHGRDPDTVAAEGRAVVARALAALAPEKAAKETPAR